ncbi:hypothetical protein SO802_025654 [Lithocarpus litseifolius]|uniref:Non-haem dioxygenase N-terminal domain-containing protein n=1 Tax=Lithocarpus litseifolius TaxID=425828 RepID=A0AAW2BXN0_9ROSI
MAEDPGVSEVVKQIDKACRESGFFYMKGHGIPDSLVKSVANNFFDLPNEEKVRIKISPAAGYKGYQRIRENVTKGIPDMHEAIDYYREVKEGMYGDLGKTLEGTNQWPSNPQNFKEPMDEFIRLCTGLLTLINQDDDITALQIYANGLYESTLHRVINNSPRFRVCTAYFYETNFDTTVEPLETCIQRTGFARNSERAVYEEHLVKKVLNNFIPELLI